MKRYITYWVYMVCYARPLKDVHVRLFGSCGHRQGCTTDVDTFHGIDAGATTS